MDIPVISLTGLAIGFIPAAMVLFVLYRWSCNAGMSAYALARMVIQLLLIGYVLNFLFASEQAWLTALALAFMLMVAGWIALRPLESQRPGRYPRALASISIGGLGTLALISFFVIRSETWYEPRVVIPLAGMIFANAMNTVSLAAERLESELKAGNAYRDARARAYRTALIPLTNSLFAVGLVSLPGMMTGQILAGLSPLTAARYQIVVMAMLFGASGIAAACYLLLAAPAKKAE